MVSALVGAADCVLSTRGPYAVVFNAKIAKVVAKNAKNIAIY